MKKMYIPTSEIWKETYAKPQTMKSFSLVERVPLSKIKIDKNRFSWQNAVDPARVNFIAQHFDLDFWMPVLVDPDYFLLDGQHRLRVAKKLGLKFIDVAIDNETRKCRYAKA